MRIIDLESHFYTVDYIEHLRQRKTFPYEVSDGKSIKLYHNKDLFSPRGLKLEEALLDLGRGRIEFMDKNGIDVQVISLTNPSVQLFSAAEGTSWAHRTNDELAEVIRQYPGRFIGLAAVAPQNPEKAAAELQRAVTELGLKGLCLYSHVRNEYLDNQKYWPVFAAAETLGVPVYIHPGMPSTLMLGAFQDYGYPLAGPILGFAADVALHTMRLIYSGLFDQYPRLQIILGHLGEGLPYWLPRLDFAFVKPWVGQKPNIQRRPSDYLKDNFTITTSGIFFQPALMCALLALGADRIAFAVDYPYESTEEALHFLKEAPICDADKEKIAHLNAERVFKLK
jgi:5-carboxyvanillate decarboxylase